jgi:hypothetical protein
VGTTATSYRFEFAVTVAFASAVAERLDAAEFERLMIGSPLDLLESSSISLDGSTALAIRCTGSMVEAVHHGDVSQLSPLRMLQLRRSVERLRARYPELYEEAERDLLTDDLEGGD